MTNEPKVRAEVISMQDIDTIPEDYYFVKVSIGERLVITGSMNKLTKAEAELIASKINAPDPIAIRQQAFKEVEDWARNSYHFENEKQLNNFIQAIDQLRRGGKE